jgi:hypothetical protein
LAEEMSGREPTFCCSKESLSFTARDGPAVPFPSAGMNFKNRQLQEQGQKQIPFGNDKPKDSLWEYNEGTADEYGVADG